MIDTRTVEASLEFLNEQLAAVAESMRQAKARGDTADLDALKVVYKNLLARAAQYRAELSGEDLPPAILLKLQAFADSAERAGNDIGGDIKTATAGAVAGTRQILTGLAKLPQAVGDLGSGLGKAVGNLPVILFFVVVLAGLYLWWQAKHATPGA